MNEYTVEKHKCIVCKIETFVVKITRHHGVLIVHLQCPHCRATYKVHFAYTMNSQF